MKNQDFGAEIDKQFINENISDQKFYQSLFGESSGNYLVITGKSTQLIEFAKKNNIAVFKLGVTKRNYLNINNQIIKLNELKNNFENSFFNYINN